MSAGRLQGKSIVITGAASGLGRAMALAFAAEGADVVVGDVRPDPRGRRSDRRSDRTGRRQRRDRLDVMVNNAIVAGRHSNGLLETEPEDWDAIMDAGLRGGRFLDLLTSAPARLRQPTLPRAA